MNALVPRPRAALSPPRAANINVMQSSSNGIAADIRVFRIDPRVVLYVVRVASTTFALTARLIGMRKNGEALDLGGLSVAPASIGSARLTVAQRCADDCETIYLEIRTDESMMRVEAPRIPAPARSKIFSSFAIGAALTMSATSVAILTLHRAPATVAPAPVAAVRAAAPAVVPQIVSLSVRRDRGPDGDSVLASYLAVGDAGSFALIGPGGKTIAKSPFTRVGTNRLPVPRAYRDAPLFARLTVLRGQKTAFASVALMPPARTTISTTPASAPVAQLLSIDGRPSAGDLLGVRIDGTLRSPHIELQDDSGNTVATRDLAPGTTRAAIPVPAGDASKTYYVVLRYMRDGAEETVVRSIVASSRS